MSSIKLKHSGGNGVSIAAPDTNPASDKTVKLPVTNGTLLTTDSSPSFRNLIINGAMQVAQRGTSSTTSGYGTVDRFTTTYGGHDEAITQEQESLTSSDTGPWALGFRKALKITNGNQTSGAGAADSSQTLYKIEGQDINHSGWDYTDPNSKITLSFWVKSSVAQTFYIRLRAYATAAQKQYISSFALSANTWTKVTKTIPGHADLAGIASDNGQQFFIVWQHFYGTDYTNNQTENAWHTKDAANNYPDMTSTWWTTNDATFHLTGVQLEAGDTATDFEHRSYGDELQRCKRYFQRLNTPAASEKELCMGLYETGSVVNSTIWFHPEMRDTPTGTVGSGTDYYHIRRDGSNDTFNDFALFSATATSGMFRTTANVSGTGGQAGLIRTLNAAATLDVSAEL